MSFVASKLPFAPDLTKTAGFYAHRFGRIFWLKAELEDEVLIHNGEKELLVPKTIMKDLTLLHSTSDKSRMGFAVMPEDLQCGLYYSPELDQVIWVISSNFLFSTIEYRSIRRARERELPTLGLRRFLKEYNFECMEEKEFDASPYAWIRKEPDEATPPSGGGPCEQGPA